jgi:hypothetical protein
MTYGIQNGNAQGCFLLQATLTPAEVATITTAEQTFTVSTLKTSDIVMVTSPSHVAGVALANARVSAANTLALTFVNPTAGGVTPAAGVYKIVVMRPENGVAATIASD